MHLIYELTTDMIAPGGTTPTGTAFARYSVYATSFLDAVKKSKGLLSKGEVIRDLRLVAAAAKDDE